MDTIRAMGFERGEICYVRFDLVGGDGQGVW